MSNSTSSLPMQSSLSATASSQYPLSGATTAAISQNPGTGGSSASAHNTSIATASARSGIPNGAFFAALQNAVASNTASTGTVNSSNVSTENGSGAGGLQATSILRSFSHGGPSTASFALSQQGTTFGLPGGPLGTRPNQALSQANALLRLQSARQSFASTASNASSTSLTGSTTLQSVSASQPTNVNLSPQIPNNMLPHSLSQNIDLAAISNLLSSGQDSSPPGGAPSNLLSLNKLSDATNAHLPLLANVNRTTFQSFAPQIPSSVPLSGAPSTPGFSAPVGNPLLQALAANPQMLMQVMGNPAFQSLPPAALQQALSSIQSQTPPPSLQTSQYLPQALSALSPDTVPNPYQHIAPKPPSSPSAFLFGRRNSRFGGATSGRQDNDDDSNVASPKQRSGSLLPPHLMRRHASAANANGVEGGLSPNELHQLLAPEKRTQRSLSQIELNILTRMYCEGASTTFVARVLDVSERTVQRKFKDLSEQRRQLERKMQEMPTRAAIHATSETGSSTHSPAERKRSALSEEESTRLTSSELADELGLSANSDEDELSSDSESSADQPRLAGRTRSGRIIRKSEAAESEETETEHDEEDDTEGSSGGGQHSTSVQAPNTGLLPRKRGRAKKDYSDVDTILRHLLLQFPNISGKEMREVLQRDYNVSIALTQVYDRRRVILEDKAFLQQLKQAQQLHSAALDLQLQQQLLQHHQKLQQHYHQHHHPQQQPPQQQQPQQPQQPQPQQPHPQQQQPQQSIHAMTHSAQSYQLDSQSDYSLETTPTLSTQIYADNGYSLNASEPASHHPNAALDSGRPSTKRVALDSTLEGM